MDATPPQQPQPEDDWLLGPAAPQEQVGDAPAHGEPVPARPRGGVLTAAGLVVAGLVAGAVGTLALGHSASDGTTTLTNAGNQQGFGGRLPQGTAPQGGDPRAGFGGGPGGGLDGEQRLQGTLTAIGSSTVSVRTSSGTATYAVTSSSELVRNGQQVALSGLRTGESVLLHVYPLNGRTVVERLFAGTLPQGGPGGVPPAGAIDG
jgi:hypothetical protein